jgi:UDP-N-acetylmuramate: L-alanyl-gamma-D-glutamyl-meso-diaminopimelate ligase
MRIHFIAIGGSIMHNLAITLQEKGHDITGSDDRIHDPARTQLREKGLLPPAEGWYPERITPDINAVIVGMHARPDNAELEKARELGLQIYSFPELVYRETKHKQRIVVAGSHGKTTVTAMLMHVLERLKRKFDYLVGAPVPGFRHSVKLSTDAPVIVLEGDEYLTSPLDERPKFLWYEPQVALITGLAWDHINVFPTYEEYKRQFQRFIETIQPNGTLIYNEEHADLVKLVQSVRKDLRKLPYRTPPFRIEDERVVVVDQKKSYPLSVLGRHNVENVQAALKICENMGIKRDDFYEAIASFGGAQKRLECLYQDGKLKLYRDFAHAPSKVHATVSALKEQFPDWRLYAFLELHTFSSLNKGYLKQYRRTLAPADKAVLYIDPEALAKKQLPQITEEEIRQYFGRPTLTLVDNHDDLRALLPLTPDEKTVVVMMSSGTFGSFPIKSLAQALASDETQD